MSHLGKLLAMLIVTLCVGLIHVSAQNRPELEIITTDNLHDVVEVARFSHEDALDSAWSPDGHIFAVGGATGVMLYDVTTLNPEPRYLAADFMTFAIAFSPDGTLLAFAEPDFKIRVWDVATDTQIAVLRGHEARVMSMAFNADNTLLVSGAQDSTVRLWSVDSGTQRLNFDSTGASITSVMFSPDESSVWAGDFDNSVQRWDVASGTPLEGFNLMQSSITTLAFSPDGARIASVGYSQILRVWDVSKQTILTARRVDGIVSSLAFNPDGSLLASGRDSGTFGILGVDTNRSVSLDETIIVFDTAFSPDGTLLASLSSDGAVQLWGVPVD